MTDATAPVPDAVLRETTAPGVLRAAAATWPTRSALEAATRHWTFAELWTDVQATARAFHALGLTAGERIAIWAPNQPEWIFAALGAQCLGAALVPLNTRLKGREAADILRRSRVRVLVTVEPFLGTDYPALLAGEALPDLRQMVRLPVPEGHATSTPAPLTANLPPLLDWNTFLASGAGVAPSIVDAAMDAIDAKRAAARHLRARGFRGPIVAHALYADHVALLRADGADEAHLTLHEAGRHLGEQALHRLGGHTEA